MKTKIIISFLIFFTNIECCKDFIIDPNLKKFEIKIPIDKQIIPKNNLFYQKIYEENRNKYNNIVESIPNIVDRDSISIKKEKKILNSFCIKNKEEICNSKIDPAIYIERKENKIKFRLRENYKYFQSKNIYYINKYYRQIKKKIIE